MEKIKTFFKNVWTVIKYVAVAIFFGIAAIFLLRENKGSKKEKDAAEKAREDKKNELEEKSPDDIAADSPNPDTISANIEREQEEFRKRVRDRLNKNIHIHRTGTSSNN